MANLEDVFVTEGRPTITYVDPPNYAQLLSDIRSRSKPVVIEGQSGTGKTTVALTIIDRVELGDCEYLTAREPDHKEKIAAIDEGDPHRVVVIDDYHRLPIEVQQRLADMAKDKADRGDSSPFPKLVIIGINQIGEQLIELATDVAKRLGIHRVQPASRSEFDKIATEGAEALNVRFHNLDAIWDDSAGDYWLIQRMLKLACSQVGVTETAVGEKLDIEIDLNRVRGELTADLRSAYHTPVKEFCRGRRFRPGNDPYFKLLQAVAEENDSAIDIKRLGNERKELKQSISNIKDRRLGVLLAEKPDLGRYFHYNPSNSLFTVEDQALFYYLKNLDWQDLRKECGFRDEVEAKEFDVAISFAGERRPLASLIVERLKFLDFSVFYDKNFEANFLGDAWSDQFERIFGRDSTYVICILDRNYREKIWPTFEREAFIGRVGEKKVIPIFTDDTKFVGIPSDIIGLMFKDRDYENLDVDDVDVNIITPLIEKLDASV